MTCSLLTHDHEAKSWHTRSSKAHDWYSAFHSAQRKQEKLCTDSPLTGRYCPWQIERANIVVAKDIFLPSCCYNYRAHKITRLIIVLYRSKFAQLGEPAHIQSFEQQMWTFQTITPRHQHSNNAPTFIQHECCGWGSVSCGTQKPLGIRSLSKRSRHRNMKLQCWSGAAQVTQKHKESR